MSRRDPYAQIDPDTLIARDWLALDRTRLANERTLLAYIRTSAALAGLGVIMAKWFSHIPAQLGGAALIVGAVVIGVLGAWRFIQIERRYRALRRDAPRDPQ